MKEKLKERIRGALLGLAIGDALARPVARLDPEAAARRRHEEGEGRLVHGASTSWALAVVDGLLYRRRTEAFDEDLSYRLQTLALSLRGRALRGGPQTTAGTLRQVARALESDGDTRLSGIDEPRGDALSAALPLAFALGDDDDEVLSTMVDAVALTHRHPEVMAAAAYLVGAARHLLRGGRGGAPALEAGREWAAKALAHVLEHRGGTLPASVSLGEGALAIAHASALSAERAEDLLAPPGLDGRDAPMRLAVAAARFTDVEEGAVHARLLARVDAGGDADVVVPLLGAMAGLTHAAAGLPLAWLDRLGTRPMVESRVEGLFGPRPPAVVPLLEDEIRVSLHWEEDAERALPSVAHDVPAEVIGPKGQIKLL